MNGGIKKIMIKEKGILPFIVILLDGWGIAPPSNGNPISLAKIPNIENLMQNYPHTKLFAHGKHVGLPENQVGNSEAGHMNIGAGRIVEQDAVVINKSIEDGTFFRNPAFVQAINHAKQNKSRIHLMGMLSDGNSPHSETSHIFALLKMIRENKIKEVYLHLFTDGRDSPQYAGLKMAQNMQDKLRFNEKIVTLMGRFYAMDRKKKWERTEMAYDALVLGRGDECITAINTITQCYDRRETDEFIRPHIIGKAGDMKKTRIQDNDSILFFNLRSDRARQLAKAFVQKDFHKKNPTAFIRKKALKNLCFVAMTDFGPDLDIILTAFPSFDIKNTLPLALEGLRQLYITETEKYAHVTYFFNGGYNGKVNGEDQLMITSPDVKSYDETPGMKGEELTNIILKNLAEKKYDFTFVNFAAPDMIGHTGNLYAGVKCCEILDELVDKIVRSYLKHAGTVIITADHGNIEEIINTKTEELITRHTTNQVPFILINKKLKNKKLRKNRVLGDIAPTILKIIGIKKPKEMTGKSLF